MTCRTSRGRVIVIGGSISGLFAGVLLRQNGWEVEIYERSTELADRGAGLTTHPALYAALEKAGMELRKGMGVTSNERILFDRSGTIFGTHEMTQIMTSWTHIYRSLLQQFPDEHYNDRHRLTDLTCTANGVTAVFENGRETRGDWLIGADGTRSTVRRLVAPEVSVNYCGYLSWRGLVDELSISSKILRQVSHRMAFGMTSDGHWLGYLVAGQNDTLNPGERRYNWVWYRAATEGKLRYVLTDSNGVYQENGMHHDNIRESVIHSMRIQAAKLLSPQIESIITATEKPFVQPIVDLGCQRIVFNRVALIGDAAFTARPHVGMGVSKAAEDADTLAKVLSGTGPVSLDTWERSRLRFGSAVLRWGRSLGSYIEHSARNDGSSAKSDYYKQPEVLLSETAASDPSPYLDV